MKNPKYQLELYQEEFVKDLLEELKEHNAIIAQLTTGGGKTIVFATIANEYIHKCEKNVIIFVHREELKKQTIEKLDKWYGIDVQEISASVNGYVKCKRVYVAMIETFNRRIRKRDANFRLFECMKSVGLVIVDEAHRSEFKKIFDDFKEASRIGFTATPISATKKDPLLNHYSSIVVGSSVKELIEINAIRSNRGVVPDITFTLDNINREKLIIGGSDFDEELMGEEFSNKKQIQNTINAYIKLANGKKMLCFNASRKHSRLVAEEMLKNKLNVRHLDGEDSFEYREDCFRWLKNTPNAILCNVGIATTGFDDPSVEGVIINKATKSFTLYHQMCGRSARPYTYHNGGVKKHHLILDMGDNVSEHGLWSDNVDWEQMFFHPERPKPGKAPTKVCPNCKCVNPASQKICKGKIFDSEANIQWIECRYVFPIKSATEDTISKEMRLVSKINIKNVIKEFENKNEYFALFEIIKKVAEEVRKKIAHNNLTIKEVEELQINCYAATDEWYILRGKKASRWCDFDCRDKFIKELKALNFIIENSENEQSSISSSYEDQSFGVSRNRKIQRTEADQKSADELYLLEYHNIVDGVYHSDIPENVKNYIRKILSTKASTRNQPF